MPKRVQVVYDLFRYLIKDYLTILITLVLVVTMWRAINTLEIMYLYGQRYKLLQKLAFWRRSNAQNKEFLDYQLKDISY